MSKVLDPVGFYSAGATTVFASRYDQRFSYCLYVPTAHSPDGPPVPLVVLQHGTGRRGPQYRDDVRRLGRAARLPGARAAVPGRYRRPGRPAQLQVHRLRRHPLRPRAAGDRRRGRRAASTSAPNASCCTASPAAGSSPTGSPTCTRTGWPGCRSARRAGSPTSTLRGPWWLGHEGRSRTMFGHRPADRGAPARFRCRWWSAPTDTETWEINNPGDSNWMDGADAHGRHPDRTAPGAPGQLHRARDHGPVRPGPRRRPRADARPRTGMDFFAHDPPGGLT